jgi:hypothetical protein
MSEFQINPSSFSVTNGTGDQNIIDAGDTVEGGANVRGRVIAVSDGENGNKEVYIFDATNNQTYHITISDNRLTDGKLQNVEGPIDYTVVDQLPSGLFVNGSQVSVKVGTGFVDCTIIAENGGKIYVQSYGNPPKFYEVSPSNGRLIGREKPFHNIPSQYRSISITSPQDLLNVRGGDNVVFKTPTGENIRGMVVCKNGNEIYVKGPNDRYYSIKTNTGEITNICTEDQLPQTVKNASTNIVRAMGITSGNVSDVVDLYNDWQSAVGTADITNISENMDDDAVDEARAKVANIHNKLTALLNSLKDLGLVRKDEATGRWIATRAFTTWLSNNQDDPNYRTMEIIYGMLPHDGTNVGVFGGDSGVTINGSLEIYNNQYNDLSRNFVRSTTTVTLEGGRPLNITVRDNGKTIVFGNSGFQLVYQNGRGFVFKKNGRPVADAEIPRELKNWRDTNVREYTYNGVKYFAVRKDADNVAIISGNRTYILNKDGTIKLGNTVIPLTGDNALSTEVRNWILRQGDLHLVSNAALNGSDDDIGQIDLDGTVTQDSASAQLDSNTTHNTRVETVLTNINDLIAHIGIEDSLLEGTPEYNAVKSAIEIITGKECTPAEFRRYRARFNNTPAMLRDIKAKLDNIKTKLENRGHYLEALKGIPLTITNPADAGRVNLSIDEVNTMYSRGMISAAQRDQLLNILEHTARELERRLSDRGTNFNNPEIVKYYQALVKIKGSDSALVRRVEGLLVDPTLTKEFFENNGTMKSQTAVVHSLAQKGYTATEVGIAYYRLRQMRTTSSQADNTVVERNRKLFGYCQVTITAADQSANGRAKALRAERVSKLIRARRMNLTAAQVSALNSYIDNGGQFKFVAGQNGKWKLTVTPRGQNTAVDLGFAWHPDVARTFCNLGDNAEPGNITESQLDTALFHIGMDHNRRSADSLDCGVDYGQQIVRIRVVTSLGSIESAISDNKIIDMNNQEVEVGSIFTFRLYSRSTMTLHLPDFDHPGRTYDLRLSTDRNRRQLLMGTQGDDRVKDLLKQYEEIANGTRRGYSEQTVREARFLLALLRRNSRVVGQPETDVRAPSNRG